MSTGADIIRRIAPAYHVRYRAPCNLRCFFCYEAPHPASAPEDLLAQASDQLHSARLAGYRTCVFGSGEIFMLCDCGRLIGAAGAFDQIWLLSNLTSISSERLDTAATAGLTGVVGTLFAGDDASAQAICGRQNVFSRQMDAIARIDTHTDLQFALHIMLTHPLIADPLELALAIRSRVSKPIDTVMISAVEPISDAVRRHPHYVTGLDLDWPGLFSRAEGEGLFLVVQNVPACRLGAWAHRSYVIRKRVGRIIQGWPEDEALARIVRRSESLSQRLPPNGPCAACPLLPVCHRYFDYGLTGRPGHLDDARSVLRALAAEEGLGEDRDLDALVATLLDLESEE